MHATAALMSLVQATLSGNSSLQGLLGPGRIFDHLPRELTPPYAVHGPAGIAAYPGQPEDGEVLFEISFWSSARGRGQVMEMHDAARQALLAPEPMQPPFVLSNLEFVSGRVAREGPTGWFRADLRYRAVIESV